MKINSDTATLAGGYRIFGNARFLSHQETMRTLTRAILRSGAEIVYTQGFNPRPRFSLPLPRNVGLASEDELFCVRIVPQADCDENKVGDLIAVELPIGFELKSVCLTEGKTAYQPVEVEYFVSKNPAEENQFTDHVQSLQEKIKLTESICIERKIDARGRTKEVDLQKFLKSVDLDRAGARVCCKVLPSGTIRPDEILNLLGIDSSKISSLIKRKKVVWAKGK